MSREKETITEYFYKKVDYFVENMGKQLTRKIEEFATDNVKGLIDKYSYIHSITSYLILELLDSQKESASKSDLSPDLIKDLWKRQHELIVNHYGKSNTLDI